MNSSGDKVFQICDGKAFRLCRQLSEVHRCFRGDIDISCVFDAFIDQFLEDLWSYSKE